MSKRDDILTSLDNKTWRTLSESTLSYQSGLRPPQTAMACLSTSNEHNRQSKSALLWPAGKKVTLLLLVGQATRIIIALQGDDISMILILGWRGFISDFSAIPCEAGSACASAVLSACDCSSSLVFPEEFSSSEEELLSSIELLGRSLFLAVLPLSGPVNRDRNFQEMPGGSMRRLITSLTPCMISVVLDDVLLVSEPVDVLTSR